MTLWKAYSVSALQGMLGIDPEKPEETTRLGLSGQLPQVLQEPQGTKEPAPLEFRCCKADMAVA